uniref:Sorcin n=1 Tax=Cyprinus carpio TaxID=7962 RepID=A0A8C1XSX2_CYPCA
CHGRERGARRRQTLKSLTSKEEKVISLKKSTEAEENGCDISQVESLLVSIPKIQRTTYPEYTGCTCDLPQPPSHAFQTYPGGFPGQQQDPLYGYFTAVAGQDGQISAEELQTCLTQANFSGGYRPFNIETCRLMISMLDRDMSCSMGFNEFKELWAVLSGWKQHFMSIDRDMSGTVDPQEMSQAVSSMGYRLSPQAMNCIIKRYSSNGKISFDDYVACCVKLRSLTDVFRKRDQAQQGVATFQYDDFIQCTMSI